MKFCQLIALLADENRMEWLVANKIIHFNRSVQDVKKKVSFPFLAPLSPSEEQAMFVIHRFRGWLGDATEEILEQLETKRIEKKSFIECWTESFCYSVGIASRERLIDHQWGKIASIVVQRRRSRKDSFLLPLLPSLSSVVQPEILVKIAQTLLPILHQIEQFTNNEVQRHISMSFTDHCRSTSQRRMGISSPTKCS